MFIFLGILFFCVALWKPLGYILGAICVISGILLNDYEDFEIVAKENRGLDRPAGAARQIPSRKAEDPEWW